MYIYIKRMGGMDISVRACFGSVWSIHSLWVFKVGVQYSTLRGTEIQALTDKWIFAGLA